jgi:Zn-dependent protease
VRPFQIARLFGIPITVEPSALLMLVLLVSLGGRDGPEGARYGLLLAAIVFGSVLVHELGHALAARLYRLGRISIVLQGMGGLTRFERPPTPGQGILVTLAGPMAGLALGVGALFAGLLPDARWAGTVAGFNLFWSIFNLVPMYPLDGGVIGFHALSHVMHPAAALRWTARGSIVAAVLVALVAWSYGEPVILVIAGMSVLQCWSLAMGPTTR